MSTIDLQKQRGWLNKGEMAASLGISPQAFDKWGVQPIARIGREAFYTAQSVVENRLRNASEKHQPDLEGIDPLAEHKLTQERLRLTAAQAYAQEQKNLVQDKLLVPVPFATFALSKVAAQIGSKLDTVGKTLRRRYPEVDGRFIESLEREIAVARNISAEFGEHLPELLDEYVESLAE